MKFLIIKLIFGYAKRNLLLLMKTKGAKTPMNNRLKENKCKKE